MTLKQSSAVHIQASYSADVILPGSSSKLRHLVLNLASVPGRQRVNSPTAQSPERCLPFQNPLMHSKNFLTTLLFHLSLITSAQISYGVKAGYTSSTVTLSEGFSTADYPSQSGIQFGAVSKGQISHHFAIMTGSLYTQKGYRETYGAPGTLGHSTYNRTISYLEIPIDLIWNTRSFNKIRLFVGTGLVPAVGLTDKTKYAIDYSGRPSDAGTTHFGFGKDKYYKSFGLGWNVVGGLDFKRLQLTADYNIGLTSVNHNGYGQTVLKNRTLAVTLGYYFVKKTTLSKQ